MLRRTGQESPTETTTRRGGVQEAFAYHQAVLLHTVSNHFPMPSADAYVGRAGAVLRVEVWDWDRGSTHDSLGSFEVKIGEELLSKQVR